MRWLPLVVSLLLCGPAAAAPGGVFDGRCMRAEDLHAAVCGSAGSVTGTQVISCYGGSLVYVDAGSVRVDIALARYELDGTGSSTSFSRPYYFPRCDTATYDSAMFSDMYELFLVFLAAGAAVWALKAFVLRPILSNT